MVFRVFNLSSRRQPDLGHLCARKYGRDFAHVFGKRKELLYHKHEVIDSLLDLHVGLCPFTIVSEKAVGISIELLSIFILNSNPIPGGTPAGVAIVLLRIYAAVEPELRYHANWKYTI